jgi:hypothetical protein
VGAGLHDGQGPAEITLGQGAAAERKLYNTFLASAFRTLHFGLTDSHARGMAIQVNYLLDKGGFVSHGDGTFSVDFAKIKAPCRPRPRVPDHRSDRRLCARQALMKQVRGDPPGRAEGARQDEDGAERYPAGADLVALAWTQHRHPEHYATVAAWMRQVRQPSPATGSHSTLAWLELAPTGAAFPVSLPVFEQASRLWRQGLLRDD